MTSRPPSTPSGGRRGFRVRPAATTPRGISTWNAAWTLTSGSTSRWLALMAGGDPVHWLAGRVAVVTGASRGIGAATAEAIAAAGAHVVIAARDREALAGVARRIADAGGEATPAPTDVSKVRDVERLFSAVERAGRLAALVCAAGVLTSVPFDETTSETWEETHGVNLTGSFLCCRAAFTAMRQ